MCPLRVPAGQAHRSSDAQSGVSTGYRSPDNQRWPVPLGIRPSELSPAFGALVLADRSIDTVGPIGGFPQRDGKLRLSTWIAVQ